MWGRCHDEGVTDEAYTQKSVSFSRMNELPYGMNCALHMNCVDARELSFGHELLHSRMEEVCKNR